MGYNKNGDWIDDNSEPNFDNGYGGSTISGQDAPAPAQNQVSSEPNYTDLINQTYQQDFGRAPDQNELSTDLANTSKYGWDTGPYGGVKATIDQRMNNIPNAGEHSNGGGGSGSGGGGNSHYDDLWKQLSGLFPGGMFNQGIVNQRADVVRDTLNRERQRTMANNQAYLADRGLVGSGPEATAAGNLDERLAGAFNDAYQNIYANESENADQRMMQALQLATGMTEAQAQQAIDQFRANTERQVGLGQLALGGGQLDLNRMLGTGDLAIRNLQTTNQNNQFYDQLQQAAESGNMDQIIKIMQMLYGGATIAAGGYYD